VWDAGKRGLASSASENDEVVSGATAASLRQGQGRL